MEHYNTVEVYFTKQNKKICMGRLLYKDRKIYFEYSADFLQTSLELSPYKLPLKAGVFTSNDITFEGLFGVFNDSLPDGWGRLLLDRKLMKAGIHPNELTPLDRLCYVGSSGMGALSYYPEKGNSTSIKHRDFDEIAEECLLFLDNDDDRFVDDLIVMNGSSAGARPKILVTLTREGFHPSNLPSKHHDDWIIKFRSSLDPIDNGPIEYAYHLMAKAAGLHLPDARLFKSKKTRGYFGVKRFDHVDGHRLHMHTVSGLLHIDHRLPSFDYESLLKATMWLTKNIQECEKQFRQAVFNALTHNRDDHVKNFSFLMDEHGNWHVSPAYDLTFSMGPAGEHCTTIMSEGKNPNKTLFLKLAEISNIEKHRALTIIDQVKDAALNWKKFAEEATVTKKSSALIQGKLDQIIKLF